MDTKLTATQETITNFLPRKILICQQRQIGDVLLATPSLALLARQYPDAEIHFLTEKKCTPILEHNPHLHTLWAINKKQQNSLLKELLWYRKITKNGYDLVVDFQQLPRSRWVVGMSGAKIRLGANKRWYTQWLYTHFAPSCKTGAYAAALKAKILEPLGIYWKGEKPELFLTDEERNFAAHSLRALGVNDSPFISIDASHRQLTRRWPAANYARLIDKIHEIYPAMRFFLPYGPGEKNDILNVQNASIHPEAFIIPNEVISLRAMAACMAHAVMHIGNCSAPRHMAVALDVPSFTILGSTSSGWTYPSKIHTDISMGLSCQPCNKNSCPIDFLCLKKLTPDLVFPAVLTHLQLFGNI